MGQPRLFSARLSHILGGHSDIIGPFVLECAKEKTMKQGYQTTEFWITNAVTILVALGVLTAGDGSELLQAVMVGAAAVVQAAYIISRGIAKAR